MFSSALFLTFCKKDEPGKLKEEDPKEEIPKVTVRVTTDAVKETTVSTAILVSTVNVSGIAEISEAGVCWSAESTPVVGGNKVVSESAAGAYNNNSQIFENTISGLEAGTQYYVRTYAVYKDSIIYGNELSFVTSTAEGLSQYWKFGETFQTGNLAVNYDASNYTVLFADQNSNGSIGVIGFPGEIASPKEYTVVDTDVVLDENKISITMIAEDGQWKSILSPTSELFTREESGRVVVEFKDVVMQSLSDKKEVKTSGLLVIP